MIGCAPSSPPPVAVSHGTKNSPFLGGSSPLPFPSPPPTLRLPPRRLKPGARAAYAAPERESEYTTTAGGGYNYSYSYSYPPSHSSSAAATTPSLYDVLGLSSLATAPEIKAAYRRLARSCHPDAASKGTGDSASAEQFMRVHAAYATLSDPEKRAEYDRGLAMSAFSPGMMAGGSSSSNRVYQRTNSYPSAGNGGSTASSTYSGSGGFQSGFGRRTWETDQCW